MDIGNSVPPDVCSSFITLDTLSRAPEAMRIQSFLKRSRRSTSSQRSGACLNLSR